MLKGISKIISPELLKILCEMGHGDQIVIADGNFPAENYGKRVVRADGVRRNEQLGSKPRCNFVRTYRRGFDYDVFDAENPRMYA